MLEVLYLCWAVIALKKLQALCTCRVVIALFWNLLLAAVSMGVGGFCFCVIAAA